MAKRGLQVATAQAKARSQPAAPASSLNQSLAGNLPWLQRDSAAAASSDGRMRGACCGSGNIRVFRRRI